MQNQTDRHHSPLPNDHYEYVNKNSKRIWPEVVLGILLCLGLVAFGIWRWYEIGQFEQTGGTIKMHRLEWALYKAGGRWLHLGFWLLCSGFLLSAVIRKARTKKRLKAD